MATTGSATPSATRAGFLLSRANQIPEDVLQPATPDGSSRSLSVVRRARPGRCAYVAFRVFRARHDHVAQQARNLLPGMWGQVQARRDRFVAHARLVGLPLGGDLHPGPGRPEHQRAGLRPRPDVSLSPRSWKTWSSSTSRDNSRRADPRERARLDDRPRVVRRRRPSRRRGPHPCGLRTGRPAEVLRRWGASSTSRGTAAAGWGRSRR